MASKPASRHTSPLIDRVPPPQRERTAEPEAQPPAPVLQSNPMSRATSVEPTGNKPGSVSSTASQVTIKPSTVQEEQPASEGESDESGLETIDMETFYQILDLDEDDTHDFSRAMAWAYFSQVDTTFVEMDEALAKKDLVKLSSLGHFLKGSSAALGVAKVQASCEKIQHYGQLRDEELGTDLLPADALAKIGPLLSRVKSEYHAAESWLKGWYREHGGEEEP
ncbi:hypothetical protein PLICRDRAFT_39081 [Plicaturopsis crispa FD-325 SS-3]|nr:hypothetical protein PLICRDRAFT_39081 [Plicaturopsis crispa FD-325 SS-3]